MDPTHAVAEEGSLWFFSSHRLPPTYDDVPCTVSSRRRGGGGSLRSRMRKPLRKRDSGEEGGKCVPPKPPPRESFRLPYGRRQRPRKLDMGDKQTEIVFGPSFSPHSPLHGSADKKGREGGRASIATKVERDKRAR